jgi:putative endonuclease
MASEEAVWYVYMVLCRDWTIYTGMTHDVTRRVCAHNNGASAGGAKYTDGRRPVTLIYLERIVGTKAADAREREIKKLTREAKLALARRAIPRSS